MIHTVHPVKYDSSVNPAFQADLRRRVHEYLRGQPNGRLATPFMWFKVVCWIVAHWGLWASLALFPHSLPVTALLIVLFATSCLGLAYNVSHDAVHKAISRHPWVNEALFQLTFNPLGPNAYLWRLRHRIMHHNCVNIPGFDFNIEASDILRFSPTQKWRPIHRWQHLYAPLAYVLFTIHWVFVKDAKMLGLRQIGNVRGIEHPWWRYLEVAGWKVVHVTLMLVVPMLALPYAWWQVLLGYVAWQLFVSFQFVLTFTGSHLNRGMVFVEPGPGDRVPHSFFEHALHTSLDFHPTDPFFSFLLGGFNAHVAHHMFPQICSVHYPALTRIIRDTAREHGLPYHEMNIVQLYVSHFQYLYDLGRSPHAPDAAYLHKAA